MEEIQLWSIKEGTVRSIPKQKLDFEKRLEDWLIKDISILSKNLAVIGSQVITAYNKKIDILAINSIGEIVIIELKREKTYREIIAQTLDYATWVKDLDYNDLNSIYLNQSNSQYTDLGEYFNSKFNIDSEEVEFNNDHKMLIVGSEIDDSTVRIINYLSHEPYSVNINAVVFNYFKDKSGNEFLAQAFITPEENIIEESKSKKRKRGKSIINQLFDAGILNIGQKFYFKPAIEQGIPRDQVEAEIVNKHQSCLGTKDNEELFSFSRLRFHWTEKFNLVDVRKYWGFGVRYDWINEDGKSLSELLGDI